MASIRRSFYINSEKSDFLNKLVNGIKGILENPQVGTKATTDDRRSWLLEP